MTCFRMPTLQRGCFLSQCVQAVKSRKRQQLTQHEQIVDAHFARPVKVGFTGAVSGRLRRRFRLRPHATAAAERWLGLWPHVSGSGYAGREAAPNIAVAGVIHHVAHDNPLEFVGLVGNDGLVRGKDRVQLHVARSIRGACCVPGRTC